ncbi:DUF397 domain-containing protein [Micromonospora sp. NBC_00617]|uniref:DUF397 domain-containing protein n=1 Tax=Micromonospora sp. NBC_00617 TaxID=2903587 RepID=UPI0030DDF841
MWRKSTRSGGEGNCVEVAVFAAAVGVRDSKDQQGPVLTFTESAWSDFVTATRAQQLNADR